MPLKIIETDDNVKERGI